MSVTPHPQKEGLDIYLATSSGREGINSDRWEASKGKWATYAEDESGTVEEGKGDWVRQRFSYSPNHGLTRNMALAG